MTPFDRLQQVSTWVRFNVTWNPPNSPNDLKPMNAMDPEVRRPNSDSLNLRYWKEKNGK